MSSSVIIKLPLSSHWKVTANAIQTYQLNVKVCFKALRKHLLLKESFMSAKHRGLMKALPKPTSLRLPPNTLFLYRWPFPTSFRHIQPEHTRPGKQSQTVLVFHPLFSKVWKIAAGGNEGDMVEPPAKCEPGSLQPVSHQGIPWQAPGCFPGI